MASATESDGDRGYATAASMMVALALSVTASAVVAGAVAEQRAARAQLERTTVSAQLNGLQLLAARTVTRNTAPGRLAWSGRELGADFSVLAEPELDKVSIDLLQAEPGLLTQLSPRDPAKAEQFLRTQALAVSPKPIVAADSSATWRACAPSVLSYVGRSPIARLAPAGAPRELGVRPHVGEIWRVVVRAEGWSDDRLVRLTGNSQQPGITLSRTFGRDTTSPCPLESAA